MRKIANILFLMLTSFFLAHALVLHHHQNNMICIESSNHDNNHQHDDNNYFQPCILSQFIPNQNNQTQKFLECGNCKTNSQILIFAVLFYEIENNSVKTVEYRLFPVIQSNYSVFVSKSLGLRAPPIV